MRATRPVGSLTPDWLVISAAEYSHERGGPLPADRLASYGWRGSRHIFHIFGPRVRVTSSVTRKPWRA